MRSLFIFVVMSSVLGLVVPGCAVSPGDKPAPEAQYGFTRDSIGQLTETNVSSLDDFTPTQTFDHSLASDNGQAVAGSDVDLACSGSCNSTSCTCTGDFDCCVAGCSICIILAN